MLNTIHFGLWLDFLFEWLPQQIFMFSTFGYMCLLIIKKWTIPWGIDVPTSSAPSIIGQMIAMPLKMGSTEGKVKAIIKVATMGPSLARTLPMVPGQAFYSIDSDYAYPEASLHLAEGSMPVP